MHRARPVASSPVLAPKVFKAYDVRGIYPDQLDEAGAYAIGRAYVQQFKPRRIAHRCLRTTVGVLRQRPPFPRSTFRK